MKLVKSLLGLLALSAASFTTSLQGEAYPPEGWSTSVFDAVEQAQAEEKRIFFLFTGSDWCGYCISLKENILDTEAFEAYAEDEFVKVFVDFPRERDLSEQQEIHNDMLARAFRVEGFPRVILLQPDYALSLITGYQDMPAEDYVAHLKNDNLSEQLSDEDQELFIEEFSSFLVQLESAMATSESAE